MYCKRVKLVLSLAMCNCVYSRCDQIPQSVITFLTIPKQELQKMIAITIIWCIQPAMFSNNNNMMYSPRDIAVNDEWLLWDRYVCSEARVFCLDNFQSSGNSILLQTVLQIGHRRRQTGAFQARNCGADPSDNPVSLYSTMYFASAENCMLMARCVHWLKMLR